MRWTKCLSCKHEGQAETFAIDPKFGFMLECPECGSKKGFTTEIIAGNPPAQPKPQEKESEMPRGRGRVVEPTVSNGHGKRGGKEAAQVFACEFAGKSCGKGVVSLGVRIGRSDELTPSAIDAIFTNAQLAVELICDGNGQGDAAGQATMFSTEQSVISAIAETHGFRANSHDYGLKLAFNREALGEEGSTRLESLLFMRGRLKVLKTGAAVTQRATAEEDGEE